MVVSVYDAGGQRVGTQAGGSLTNVLVYDAGGKLVAEYGSPASSGGTQYLLSDQQGSPRTITNASGTVVSRHDYLPFGEELSAGVGLRNSNQGYGGVDAARQKYAGMESDDATGMDHTLWRQYDSSFGRWTSPDPYTASMTIANPQSFNRYSYVGNDPVNMREPSGLMTKEGQPDPDAAAATEEPPGDPFETGRDIIGAAEARHDRWVDIDRAGGKYGDADYPKASKGDTAIGGDAGKAGGDTNGEAGDDSSSDVPIAKINFTLPTPCGQERCTPEGDGPYVLKLPQDFGTSTADVKGGPIGDGECMQLVQTALERQGTPLGEAGYGRLKRGAAVSELPNIKKGTLIASGWHPDGYYANYYPHGNHAAFFLQWTQKGFLAYEQVNGHLRVVEKRWGEGGYYSNANAYHVVLTGSRIPGVPRKQKYSVY